ncbi:hypothetical protein AALO_G00301080 [Alosa alosa]|uniref:Barrier-to-autointegration factor n=1 Tax=Alosa alosa TaxID=278164 RepID=A0AAV6FJ50_9TELE|nr:barrier-to-autointegration factor-like [Alosa alosa]KAG5261192.1 hypothetical protein AALO_G00301080 [Alosa alosa]
MEFQLSSNRDLAWKHQITTSPAHYTRQSALMSSTSKKHQSFCSEPMKGKPVTALPGIGPAHGSQLQSSGYRNATDVFGKYLTVHENCNQFEGWLRDESGAYAKQQGDCYRALREWTDNNL